MIWVISLLLKFEILGLFVNTLTADYKYPIPYFEKLSFHIKTQLSLKWVFFSSFLFHLWNLHQIWNIFNNKKIVIAAVFPKLQTVNDLFRPFSEKDPLRTSFNSQHVKGPQTLAKSALEHFYYIFSSFLGEMIWKISNLLKFEMIVVFVNTVTVNYRHPVPGCENLVFPIQMQLS